MAERGQTKKVLVTNKIFSQFFSLTDLMFVMFYEMFTETKLRDINISICFTILQNKSLPSFSGDDVVNKINS